MDYSNLINSFLFRGLSSEQLEIMLEKNPPYLCSYRRGEEIYSSTHEEKLVGFIVSGRCEVRITKADGNRVVLNTLSDGASFGILSVYSSETYPTQLFALKNSEILFFTSEQIRDFVNSNLQIATNLIEFLAGRISFLNKKIVTFSGTRVEDRLSAYLLSEAYERNSYEFDFNCCRTANEINAGRASVYRALDSLEKLDIISFNNKKIIINDPRGLERNIK